MSSPVSRLRNPTRRLRPKAQIDWVSRTAEPHTHLCMQTEAVNRLTTMRYTICTFCTIRTYILFLLVFLPLVWEWKTPQSVTAVALSCLDPIKYNCQKDMQTTSTCPTVHLILGLCLSLSVSG